MAFFGRLFCFRKKLGGIRFNRTGQNDQLNYIDPTLTTFNSSNERLMAFELLRQVSLRHPSLLTSCDQGLAQRLMS